jgi:acetamidase/formamidase
MGRSRILLSFAACAIGALLSGAQEPAAQTATPAPAAPVAPTPTIPIPPAASPAPAVSAPAAAPQTQGAVLPSAYGPMQESLMVAPAAGKKPTVHLLPATLETTQWGWFDNAQTPVLHIHSGDVVAMETMMHAHNQVVPGTTIEQIKKTRTDYPGRGPHTLTGPIFVEEAEPGDILKVRINKIVPRAYATNFNVPGMFGEFPKEFPDGQVKYFYLDLDKMTMDFAPGIVIPLRPFPGTIGVARAEPGRYSSVPPGRFGGNMDINEMVVGTTLYLPVFVKGALLWSGDSHAGQGNGEINLTAIETAYKELNLTIEVIKGRPLSWPRVETPTHWITIGYDQDLNKAFDLLKAETTTFLIEEKRAANQAAADKMMIANWDCRISEVVDVLKGTYCMNPKAGNAKGPVLPTAENAKYLVTYAKDADLNKAMDTASMAMINLLQEKRKLSRIDAYALASMAMDCRLLPPKAAEKEVSCLMPKSLWIASK